MESLQFVVDEGGASPTSSSLMDEKNLSCIGKNNVSLLAHLEISNCPSLKCVSSIVDLAAMLKQLQIKECPNLTSLSSRDTLPTNLKVLCVEHCPKLKSIVVKLHKDTLLEDLVIIRCEKLLCLPRGLHELCHLKRIYIEGCNSLISVGELAPTNLRELNITECEKLETLPNNMHKLNLLQLLFIRECPSIKSFPKEGFPTDLRELWLSGPNLCEQVFELGLHRLTFLTFLWITNGIMDSFPEEENGKTMLMLPTSLTTLRFYNFPNLLFLSWKFFQNLSALEEIFIVACPKLASLSEKCFPPSLQRLDISSCPVLKQHCEKDKGIMWSKIANIPSVRISERSTSLPGTMLFRFIIFQFKNFYDYTIKSSLFVYLNNMILKIQTLTQANSCSVAVKASFKTWRRYVKFWLVYVQFFFPSFNN